MKRFTIRLQPIMSLTTRQLCGYEVLSEPPTEDNIAEWFEQCSSAQLLQLRTWQLKMLESQKITVKLFVNLTTTILASEEGTAALLQGPLPGVVELQDPMAIARLDATRIALLDKNLRRLRHAGMEVWLDDYLSDYGSTLADSGLEFDGVKLDCAAFQQYRNDSAGLAHLIAEARRFGTFVLAEGVESQGDVRAASLAGADLAQGFYWPEKKIHAVQAPSVQTLQRQMRNVT
ncbi:EAL domain-containing protein [Enterobacter bugandensis]|uniref:EAL domain-containing protein n=1 Tax=Enterobacter bugandensis TaxID=881260 RepID=UPI00398B4D89